MNPKYLDYLYNLGLFNIKLGLSTIREMLSRLGNPHQYPRIIHFAGTNGKGSTLITLEKLLLDTGFSVGSTISPHLKSYNERFRINGIPVSDSELDKAFETVCHACGIDLGLKSSVSIDGAISPTFFEFSIAMAFWIFHQAKSDFILLETGMGGRLDATNVIEQPLATVITKIDYDHQEYLGETLKEITIEKLGILKKNSPLFVSQQNQSVLEHICRYTSGLENIPLIYSPKDFDYTNLGESTVTNYRIRNLPIGNENGGNWNEIPIFEQSLKGNHQKENTATALAVYLHVIEKNRQLSSSDIASSINSIQWQGRLTYLDDQKILIDGAHNSSGMNSLLEYLAESHPDDEIVFAISWKKDKQLFDDPRFKITDNIAFLPILMTSESAENIDGVVSVLKQTGRRVLDPISVNSLVANYRYNRLPNHQLLVVAGSLYLLGEFLNQWNTDSE